MSLIVVDFTKFTLGVDLYHFSEKATEKYVINTSTTVVSDEICKYVMANKEINKIVFIGAEKLTEGVKKQLSSSLEAHYGYSNPVEIELKSDWL